MKIGYCNDWHLADKVPLSRNSDTFYAKQKKKLSALMDIFIEEKVDFFINNGDLFDVYKPSIKFVNEILDILNTHKIPMIINLGNHDIIGYNLSSYTEAAVGILEEFKHIKVISSLQTMEHNGVELVFVPIFNSEMHKFDFYKFDPKSVKPRICITHNSISPNGVPFKHLLCSDIMTQCTPINTLFLCGHIHAQFDVAIPDRNVRFLNAGCLMRTSISEKSIRPCAYIIEIQPDGWWISKKEIILDDTGEFHEKESLVSSDLKLDGFFSHLDKYSWDGINLEQHIQNLEVELPVKEELIRRLKTYA